MQYLATLTSAILALVFFLAGAGKLLNQPRTRRAIVDLGAPQPAAPLLGALLPVAELATGSFLLIPTLRWYGGTAGLVLLAIFLTAIARAYRQGATADCACFGRETKSGVGPAALLRNVILMGLALGVLLTARPPEPTGTNGVLVPLLVATGAGLCTLVLLRRNAPPRPSVVSRDGLESPFQWPLEDRGSGKERPAFTGQ